MGSGAGPGGRLVVRRYRLQARIGQGGMGTVWRAYDELLGRTIAIKEINLPDLAEIDQAELRERAMREARAAARLSHPNTITVHDVVEEDGSPWIVMALVDADSLAEVMRTSGPLPPTRVAEIGLAVLSALDEAHDAGILHRDVKPGNVLLGRRGRIVLTDFGIATLEGDPAMTTAGLLLGAPAYMAPERAAGMRLGPASDLWSLGATLYAAVEGRPPYDRESAMATLTAMMNEPLQPPRVAGRLTPTLMGLLVHDPSRRLDARSTRHLLEQALRDPGEHGTRFLPAYAGQPVGGSRNGERTQVVARPKTGAPSPAVARYLTAAHPAFAAATARPAATPAAVPAVAPAPAAPITARQPQRQLESRPQPQTAAAPGTPAGREPPVSAPSSRTPDRADSQDRLPRRLSRWWPFRIALTASLVLGGLVAALGSPRLARYVERRQPVPARVSQAVGFPAWVIPDPPVQSAQTALAMDARAALVVLLTGFLIYRLLRLFPTRRGRTVVLVVCWLAIVVASALAGLIGSPLVNGVLGSGITHPQYGVVDFAIQQAADGAVFGSTVGWLPALFGAAVAGRRRPRPSGPQ